MRKTSWVLLLLLTTAVYFSCTKNNDGGGNNNPCSGVTVSITGNVTSATQGQSNGSIAATAAGGSGFTYSLNSGTFQPTGTFSNLAAGTYTVTAKNSAGCTGTQQFTIGSNNPCTGVAITITPTVANAVPCGGAAGGISIAATGSTGFTYSMNNGTFQAGNSFTNLAAGNYAITVRDANGCTQTANVAVTNAQAGTLFTNVKTIITANCAVAGCHDAAASGGINFTNDCNIIASRARIKVRAVDDAGTANQMPPPPRPALTAAQRQAITDWITAGGGYTN